MDFFPFDKTVAKISFLCTLFPAFFQLICNNDNATEIYIINVIYWPCENT